MGSVKKNFIYNTLYQIMTIVLPLVTTPYISRVLGPSNIGEYSYAYSVSHYFVLFIMLGLVNYGSREISQVGGDKESRSKCFWNIYAMQLCTGVVVVILYVLYCVLLASEPLYAVIMGVYVLSSVFDINWFFTGTEQFKLISIRNMIIKVLSFVAILMFVKAPSDTWIYCLIFALSFLATQATIWPYLFKQVIFVRPAWKHVKPHILPNLTLFLTVISISLYKIMDKIMLGIMSNKAQLGFYESSERVLAIPMALVTSLGSVMLPRMSRMAVEANNESKAVIHKSMCFAMLLVSSLSFGIMGVAKEFVPLFYGKGYDVCVVLYQILLPSCIFMAFANVIRTQYLLPAKRDTVYLASTFLGAVINLIINVLLIPTYGAVGAGIGTLAAELALCLYHCFASAKELPITKYIMSSVPFLASGLAMYFVIYNLSIDAPYALLIKIGLGASIYACGILLYYFVFAKKQLKELIK